MAARRASGSKTERTDRSVQTDARAKPARPESGTASGALKAPVVGSTKSVTLEEGVFAVEVKPHLVHETVVAEQNEARAGTRGAKSRGMVAGGRAKPWRQKGTGRARAGTTRAPHWTGGGVAFPPTMRSFGGKVNRKARKAAMRGALSAHAQEGTLGVVDPSAFDAPSTKAAIELLGTWGKELPLLVVAQPEEEGLIKSFRNLERVVVTVPGELEVVDLVRARSLLISESAVDLVQGRAS